MEGREKIGVNEMNWRHASRRNDLESQGSGDIIWFVIRETRECRDKVLRRNSRLMYYRDNYPELISPLGFNLGLLGVWEWVIIFSPAGGG